MNKEIAPVLDEIEAILKKHDMLGLMVVANKSHTDWRMRVDASWSCAWTETNEENHTLIRIRSKLTEYPSREAQTAALTNTVGTFVTLGDTIDRLKLGVNHILVMLSKHVDFIGKSTDVTDKET